MLSQIEEEEEIFLLAESISSPTFFNPNSVTRRVEYYVDVDDKGTGADMEAVMSGLKEKKNVSVHYQRAPKTEVVDGQRLVSIKYLCHARGDAFSNIQHLFFIYKGYNGLLKEHQSLVTQYCSAIESCPNYRIRTLAEVPIGGIFGLKINDGTYARIRVVKINFRTMVISYWAIDIGEPGTCKASDLIHLNEDCLFLTMLVIPGILENDPKPEQLRKVEGKEPCLAIVKEPKLICDYAPRKLTLVM